MHVLLQIYMWHTIFTVTLAVLGGFESNFDQSLLLDGVLCATAED